MGNGAACGGDHGLEVVEVVAGGLGVGVCCCCCCCCFCFCCDDSLAIPSSFLPACAVIVLLLAPSIVVVVVAVAPIPRLGLLFNFNPPLFFSSAVTSLLDVDVDVAAARASGCVDCDWDSMKYSMWVCHVRL